MATWPAGLVDIGTVFLSEALVSTVLDKRTVSDLGQETAIRALATGVLGPISSAA